MRLFVCFISAVCLFVGRTTAAEQIELSRDLDVTGFTKPVPVFISGYAGEVDTVLRFDLTFMGFKPVSQPEARFEIQKNNAAGVGAQVLDPLQRKYVYNRAFTGGSARQQTHALADDLAKTLLQMEGIAQTRVAFKVQASGIGAGEIYVADYDGFNAQPVTADKVICASPAWIGRSGLTYISYKLNDKPVIFFHDLGSGARKIIANYPGSNISPAASRDGKRIAMVLSKSGSPDLYVANIDGTGLTQLTRTKELESDPCWSPNGGTLCVVSEQSGKRALYTISANGGALQRLPVAGAPNPTAPDWSPDGKFIVFTSQRGGGFDLWLAPMEGARRGQAMLLVEGEDPVWAPNSRTVMFVRTVNHRRVLALLDVPTKTVREIARVPGSASYPSWAR